MGNGDLSRQDLARLAAAFGYALLKNRSPREPLRRTNSAAGAATCEVQAVARSSSLKVSKTRTRDARRVDAHRARLSARGLRIKAAPFIPRDYVFVGPGLGWVPAK